jgi:hypothetical protein
MKISYIEIAGFRSYGATPQRIDLESALTVIHADNSQGKTSFAEAIEFLYSGSTSRRAITGGSPSEFQDALRNAHLLPPDVVYVEAGIRRGSNTQFLRRTLTKDYAGASECESTLTIDGIPISTVADAGIVLSDPPLAAPVLLEHTLRYVVAAKPSDRSNYFKAILEVSDLDLVQSEIAELIRERELVPRSAILDAIDTVASVPKFSALLGNIVGGKWKRSALEAVLVAACSAVAPPEATDGVESAAIAGGRVRKEYERRRALLFPIDELENDQAMTNPLETMDLELFVGLLRDDTVNSSQDYQLGINEVDDEMARLLPLLEIALQVVGTPGADEHPIDCPLCATPGSLTAERIAAIRTQVLASSSLARAAKSTIFALRKCLQFGKDASEYFSSCVPAAASWPQETVEHMTRTTEELGGDAGAVAIVVDSIARLKAESELGLAASGLFVIAAQKTLARVEQLRSVTGDEVDGLLHEVQSLSAMVDSIRGARREVAADVHLLRAIVADKLDNGSDTAGWTALIDLAEGVDLVVSALNAHQSNLNASTKLKKAQREVSSAIRAVLDGRLLSMGEEIGKWWGLMRPDELTTFERIARRGAGSRFLDVTAALAPDAVGPSVVMNALAVLSNSQLNALGLATFLARSQMMGTPLIVLDDPVPGSDREHRATFASGVVEALLEDDRQVIVATHDSELARHLAVNHQHRSPDRFEAYLLDPREGTTLVRAGDDFENHLLEAKGQMHSPLPSNRRAAGNSLRVATERLAKLVIVAGRLQAGETHASIEEYTGKNLRDLRPLANAYVVKSNEPGQWTMLARVLNDADHDGVPPTSTELVNAHQTLRAMKRQHQDAGRRMSDI